MSTIYQTLQGCLSGNTLTLPATAFGAGNIQDTITEYFGTDLVITGVSLTQQGSSVIFTNAVITSAPLNTMTVSAIFSEGTDGVDMLLTATPAGNWNFATGWPLLAGSWMEKVDISAASFILSSIATGTLNKGINFSGTLGFTIEWSAVLWLLNGQGTIIMSGTIRQTGTVPVFTFSTALGAPVSIPPLLDNLALSLQIGCAAISGAVVPPAMAEEVIILSDTGPVASEWVPQTMLKLLANLQFTPQVSLPIFIDLSTPSDAITITADVTNAGMVAFSDFVHLLPGVNFQSYLPGTSTYDPGTVFTFRTLSFTIQPATQKIISVDITLGTTAPWTITQGISVGPINLIFQVQPLASPVAVSATLLGTVSFTGGAMQLGAFYPGFIFTGDLTTGSQINLVDLMQQLLPIQIDATLILDELNFVVQPTTGAYSLVVGLNGDWSIPVGLATIHLTNAWLNLDRQSSVTTGAIGIQGNLAVSGIIDPITFDGSWTLPGTFAMNAQFPAISFTSLAQTLSGTTLPQGVPDIGFAEGAIGISLNTSKGEYTFSLSAIATVNGSNLGAGVFQIRKATTYGYLVGFVIPQAWSPAQIWSGLSSLFGDLFFSNSGLLISTLPAGTTVALPNMQMPSVPTTVNPGFVFFSTLELKGNILGPVSELFANDIVFNLMAVVDTSNPMNSEFQAIMPAKQTHDSIEFTGITIILKPAATSFSISAGAILTIQNDKITLLGTGAITLTPLSLAFTIEVDNWVNPFGIENLTIQEFGLQVKVETAGVTLGFLGSFLIGTAPRTFTLVIGGEIIDFEAPGAIIFELINSDPANPLMLYDLIKQFTQLDLSQVPVLNAIGFNDLEFWVVDDPAGFKIGTYTFPPGIGVVADIFIYSWEAKFNIQVNFNKGIIASGSINKPIELGGIFSLSDTAGTKGPSGSIDTSAFSSFSGGRMMQANTRLLRADPLTDDNPYFTLDGKVVFLGITESIKAKASRSSFDFELAFNFFSIVTANVKCSLADATHFSASAAIVFDLNVTLGPYSVGGVELIPRVTINGPGASLSLGVTINPTVIAQITVGLQFSWASMPVFNINVTISLADIGNDLNNLYQAVITWLQNNVGKVFEYVLSNVSAWIEALGTVFSDLGKDIDKVADALANFFQTSVSDAAAFLKDLGFGFEAIVDALVDYFKIAYDEAVQIVEALWNDCSMTNAFDQIEPGASIPKISVRDLQYELTKSEKGQRMLLVWYGYGDEIWSLLAPYPKLRQRLSYFNQSPRGANNLRWLIDTQLEVLNTVAPHASPALKEHIAAIIPPLYAARHFSHYQFLESLKL
jgi:hypothetical protein